MHNELDADHLSAAAMSSCCFRDEAAADPHIESFVYHAAMPTDLKSIKSNQILGFNQSTARPNHAYRFAQLGEMYDQL